MRERQVTFPTIALIAGTRVALGVGLGLLLASRLTASALPGGLPVAFLAAASPKKVVHKDWPSSSILIRITELSNLVWP